jgi:ABC-type transporter Mla subunit MlaD
VVVDASVPVREDARIELKTDGFIGDRFLDILPGTGNVLPAGSTILGAIGGLEGTLSSVSGEGINEILTALRTLLADGSQPNSLPVVLGSLRYLADDLRPRLTTTLAALELLLTGLKTEFATLSTSVTGEVTTLSNKGGRALERLEKTVAESGESLKRLTSDLHTSLGAVQKTLARTDTVLSTSQKELVPLLRGLQDLSTRLQQDTTATLASLQQVLTHIDTIVVQNDRNIYISIENLRDTLDNLKGASQQVRANPAVLVFGTRNQPDTGSTEAPSVTRTLQDRGRIGRYDKVQ